MMPDEETARPAKTGTEIASPQEAVSADRFDRSFPKIGKWDKNLARSLYNNPKLQQYNPLWQIISYTGDPRLWGVLALGLFIEGVVNFDFELFVIFLAGFFQSFLIYYLIKQFFKRKRPFLQDPNIERLDRTGHGFSFPSGHCHHSTILYGLIILVWLPHWFLPLLFLSNFAVGFSRILLGCHYPSDTIVGSLEAYLELALYWGVTKILYVQVYTWAFSLLFS